MNTSSVHTWLLVRRSSRSHSFPTRRWDWGSGTRGEQILLQRFLPRDNLPFLAFPVKDESKEWDSALKIFCLTWNELHWYCFLWCCDTINDLAIGWQNLNLLSHLNTTLAPQARQARASGEILNYVTLAPQVRQARPSGWTTCWVSSLVS